MMRPGRLESRHGQHAYRLSGGAALPAVACTLGGPVAKRACAGEWVVAFSRGVEGLKHSSVELNDGCAATSNAAAGIVVTTDHIWPSRALQKATQTRLAIRRVEEFVVVAMHQVRAAVLPCRLEAQATCWSCLTHCCPPQSRVVAPCANVACTQSRHSGLAKRPSSSGVSSTRRKKQVTPHRSR